MNVKLGIVSICLTLIYAVIADITGHIAGGEYSFINDFPHSMFLKLNCVHMPRCGGSLITQNLLLTAGKCFHFCKKPYNIDVSMGNEREGLGLVRKVVDFIIHEKFSEHKLANDIALGWLNMPVRFSPNIRRVALMETPPYYQPAFVAGWGWIGDNQEFSIYLKHTSQHLVNMGECRRSLGNRIAEGTFCMQNRFYSTRPYEGDTGAALIVSDYIQIGIVSWGDRNYHYSKIIYTNISYHLDWIKTKAEELYCRNNEH